LAEW